MSVGDAQPQLPTGVVSLLFSDVEGSTALLQQLGPAYGDVLARCRELLRDIWQRHGGLVVDSEGDAFFVAFDDPVQGLRSAAAAHQALAQDATLAGMRIRIGVHSGTPQRRDGRYWGLDVHYAARVCSAAHGGQTLVGESTVAVLDPALLEGLQLEDLGQHALKDFPSPRRLFHMGVDGRPASAFPPVRTLRAGRTNLPDQTSTFVGRRTELAAVAQQLTTNRLVTLTGPGGVGKTRLAFAVAARMLDGSGDGAWWVDLTAVTDSDRVAAAVAAVLRVQEQPGRGLTELLSHALAGRRLLLVVDNCEQVLQGAAALLSELLSRCPELTVLATSRQALSVSGEQVHRVPPLAFPATGDDVTAAEGSEAVELFLQRARLQRPDLTVNDETASVILSVCRRLEGIPLALELAAARLRTLSLRDLEERLGRRFDLLSRGPADGPSRQRTLWHVVDWSYQMLSPDEALLLARLSAFAGGCSLDAAEHVGQPGLREDVLDALDGLVDKSLVSAEHVGGRTRYRLLETVREYAAAKLAELPDEQSSARRRHLDHYRAVAEAAEPELTRRDQVNWLERLDQEHDNMRVALATARADDPPESALRLAVSLALFRRIRGHSAEGAEDLLWELSRSAEIDPLLRGWALVRLGLLQTYDLGEHAAALSAVRDVIATARKLGNDRLVAEALYVAAFASYRLGDLEGAWARTEEAFPAATSTHDEELLGRLHKMRGIILIEQQRDFRAAHLEALRLFTARGDLFHIAEVHINAAFGEMTAGHLERAREHSEKALPLLRLLGEQRGWTVCLENNAHRLRLEGNESAALAEFCDLAQFALQVGDRSLGAYCIQGAALLVGDDLLSLELHATAEETMRTLGETWAHYEEQVAQDDAAGRRGRLRAVAPVVPLSFLEAAAVLKELRPAGLITQAQELLGRRPAPRRVASTPAHSFAPI